MSEQKEPMIKLGGLWEHEGRNGRYLSGSIGMAKLLVFENNHRDNDNAPTHIVYLASAPRRDESQSNGARGQSSNSDRSLPRGSYGGGRGVQRTENRAGDPPGTERFEVQPGELDSEGELEVPF